MFEQPTMPRAGALGTRGRVAAAGFSGVTESHRDDGDVLRVVERVAVEPHPAPQAFATRVVPRNSRGVNSGSRGLSRNQDFRRRAGHQNRARTEREVLLANSTRANLGEQFGQGLSQAAPEIAASNQPLLEQTRDNGFSVPDHHFSAANRGDHFEVGRNEHQIRVRPG